MLDFFVSFYTDVNFVIFLLIVSIALTVQEKRHSHFGVRISASAAGAVLLSGLLSLLPRIAIAYILKYLICFCAVCGVLYLSFEITQNQAVYYGICGYAVQHIGQNLFIGISTCFALGGWQLEENQWLWIVLEVFFNLLSVGVFLTVFGRHIQELSQDRVEKKLILPLCTLLIATVGLYIFGFSVSDPIAKLLMEGYAILLCITVLYTLYKTTQIGHILWEKDTMQLLLRKQQKQYEVSRRNIEFINVRVHDFKKQMQILKGNIPKERLAELENNIGIYENTAETGNETLDVILTEFAMRCEQEHIVFTYIVDGARLNFMDTIDLCSLFYNLLENAVESVRKIEKEDRVISLKVSTFGNLIQIVSYNSVAPFARLPDGDRATDKANQAEHGFGLKSMSMTVQRYGGEMKYGLEDDIFSIHVLLPLA